MYRRHQKQCPLFGKPRILDACQCVLYAHGKLHGKFVRPCLNTRDWKHGAILIEEMLAGRGPDDDPKGGIGLVSSGPRPSEVTLEFAASEFEKANKNLSTNTKKNYADAVAHFLSWAGTHNLTRLQQVETPHIDQYFEQAGKTERGTKWTPKTVNTRLTHLRVFFNYCVKTRRWLAYPPTEDRRMFKRLTGAEEAAEDRAPFQPEEVTRILAAVEQMPEEVRDKTRALILLMLYSGMRISDATFFEREFLTKSNTADYFVIKNRRQIDLPPELHQKAIDALQKLPASRVYFFQPDMPDDYREARYALRHKQEFGAKMPDYTSRIYAATALVTKVLALAGITEGACHRFRDTFAVNMLVGDGGQIRSDIYTVSKMLGHSDVKITDKHYAKLIKGYRESMSKSTRCLTYVFPEAA